MPGWIEHVWKCDQCPETIRQQDTQTTFSFNPPPAPWREIRVLGWAGKFVACSDACEAAIRGRMERPETHRSSPPAQKPVKISLGAGLIALDRCRLGLSRDLEPGPRALLESAIRELEAATKKAKASV